MLKSDSPIPLYYQLQEHLRSRIESGEFSADTPLPTEAHLSEVYGVSRATVREALRSLVELGLVEKKHGVGTFVSKQKFDEQLPGLNSFSMEMASRGYSVKSEVLEKKFVEAPSRVIKAMQIPEGSRVLQVRRLRAIDDKPILVSSSFLPDFVSIEDDFSDSIYKLFKSKYHIQITQGQATIEAGLANTEIAHLLKIDPNSSVLQVTWLAMTMDRNCVEYSEGTYRGDSYRYIVKVQR